MSNKQQLKPLTHKKVANNGQYLGKPALTKEISKPEPTKTSNNSNIKPPLTKKSSNGDATKPVKYQRSGQRSTKTIEHYDCDDFELQIEDNNYFQTQLQKNIKTEILNKTGKPQAKAQIVLPKLESDLKMRNMKQLEKEMDEQMSKMMDHIEFD